MMTHADEQQEMSPETRTSLTLKLWCSAQDSRIHIVLNEDKQDDKNEEDHSSNSRGDGYEKEPGKKMIPMNVHLL